MSFNFTVILDPNAKDQQVFKAFTTLTTELSALFNLPRLTLENASVTVSELLIPPKLSETLSSFASYDIALFRSRLSDFLEDLMEESSGSKKVVPALFALLILMITAPNLTTGRSEESAAHFLLESITNSRVSKDITLFIIATLITPACVWQAIVNAPQESLRRAVASRAALVLGAIDRSGSSARAQAVVLAEQGLAALAQDRSASVRAAATRSLLTVDHDVHGDLYLTAVQRCADVDPGVASAVIVETLRQIVGSVDKLESAARTGAVAGAARPFASLDGYVDPVRRLAYMITPAHISANAIPGATTLRLPESNTLCEAVDVVAAVGGLGRAFGSLHLSRNVISQLASGQSPARVNEFLQFSTCAADTGEHPHLMPRSRAQAVLQAIPQLGQRQREELFELSTTVSYTHYSTKCCEMYHYLAVLSPLMVGDFSLNLDDIYWLQLWCLPIVSVETMTHLCTLAAADAPTTHATADVTRALMLTPRALGGEARNAVAVLLAALLNRNDPEVLTLMEALYLWAGSLSEIVKDRSARRQAARESSSVSDLSEGLGISSEGINSGQRHRNPLPAPVPTFASNTQVDDILISTLQSFVATTNTPFQPLVGSLLCSLVPNTVEGQAVVEKAVKLCLSKLTGPTNQHAPALACLTTLMTYDYRVFRTCASVQPATATPFALSRSLLDNYNATPAERALALRVIFAQIVALDAHEAAVGIYGSAGEGLAAQLNSNTFADRRMVATKLAHSNYLQKLQETDENRYNLICDRITLLLDLCASTITTSLDTEDAVAAAEILVTIGGMHRMRRLRTSEHYKTLCNFVYRSPQAAHLVRRLHCLVAPAVPTARPPIGWWFAIPGLPFVADRPHISMENAALLLLASLSQEKDTFTAAAESARAAGPALAENMVAKAAQAARKRQRARGSSERLRAVTAKLELIAASASTDSLWAWAGAAVGVTLTETELLELPIDSWHRLGRVALTMVPENVCARAIRACTLLWRNYRTLVGDTKVASIVYETLARIFSTRFDKPLNTEAAGSFLVPKGLLTSTGSSAGDNVSAAKMKLILDAFYVNK